MQQYHKHKILVTRPLPDELISFAHTLTLDPLIIPALEVEYPGNWKKIVRKIESRPKAPWVFTSRNAVHALSIIQQSDYRVQTGNRIFAVGMKTAGDLEALALKAEVPERQDAAGLARLIINESKKSGFTTCIHWAGNRSRDELKTELTKAGLELVPVEVYQTSLRKMDFPAEPVEAVLFYSPSAVEAFRQNGGIENQWLLNSKLFAIGNTTGAALSLETGKSIYISPEPSTESLLKTVAKVLAQESS